MAGFTGPASLTDNPHTTQHPKLVKKNNNKIYKKLRNKIKNKKRRKFCEWVSCVAHWLLLHYLKPAEGSTWPEPAAAAEEAVGEVAVEEEAVVVKWLWEQVEVVVVVVAGWWLFLAFAFVSFGALRLWLGTLRRPCLKGGCAPCAVACSGSNKKGTTPCCCCWWWCWILMMIWTHSHEPSCNRGASCPTCHCIGSGSSSILGSSNSSPPISTLTRHCFWLLW